MKRDKERDFENSSLCTRIRCYTGHCLPYRPQFHYLQVRVPLNSLQQLYYTRPRGRDLLSSLDHGDSVLGLRCPYMLSGYDLGQLHMRKIGLTYPPEV